MKTETILNSNELAAVKDCLKRYISFNNNGVMSSYKVKQSNLLLMDERDIDIDYKKKIVLKENKPIYRINGNDYIVVCGYKVPLNECIRFGTMWE